MEKEELYRYTGNEAQLFGIRRFRAEEGQAGGETVLQVYTAAGLEVDILPGTGLDIGRLSYKGTNISWISKNGPDSAASFIPFENEFTHSFPGGMLYTCGLRSVGPANRDGGEWHPLHGRIHGQAAEQVAARVEDGGIIVSGVMRESALFGHLFQMKRTITIPAWGGSVTIEDTIENLTPNAEEFMLLYHLNFGYPMLSEHATLELPSRTQTKPRSPEAAKGMGKELEFSKPVDNEPEQVFFHTMAKGEAVLKNKAVGILAKLCWDTGTLPVFAEWKSMASGDYVLGLEPANNYIMGRGAERDNGTLPVLGGFESMQTKIQLELEEILP